MTALDALLAHPHETGIEGDVVSGGPGAKHHHPSTLDDKTRDRERRLARVFEDEIDIVALAGEGPNGLPELAALLHVGAIGRRIRHLRQPPPAVVILPVDDAARTERQHEIGLLILTDDTDGIGAGGGDQLDGHGSEAPGGSPHQHVVTGSEDMRPVAEQHAVGRRQGQGIAGRLLPGEMARTGHELLGLDSGELGEAAIAGLVAPDALTGGIHRIAAIAFLIVAIVLVAVYDDLVTDLPALHPGPDGPDNSRGIGSGDVDVALVNIEGTDGNAERGPHAVVVDTRRHDENQDLVAVDLVRRQHLHLHRRRGFAVAFTADGPRIHVGRHMSQWRDLADFVEILDRRLVLCGRRIDCHDHHSLLSVSTQSLSCCIATCQRGTGCNPIVFGQSDVCNVYCIAA